MRVGAIDVGTNTVLMLVADVAAAGHSISTVADEQRVIRVGEGIHHSGRIGEGATVRLISALRELTELASQRYGILNPIVVGTSVFRRASNAQEVLERVHQTTGVAIEIIDGDEEARLTYAGACSGRQRNGTIAVVDVGGGSTEIIVGAGEHVLRAVSVNEGVVVAREEFYPAFPPPPETIGIIRGVVRERIATALQTDWWNGVEEIVAVAGTPTTLAAIDLALPRFDAVRIEGHRLSRYRISAFVEQFHRLTREELLALPTVDPLRADLLPAGAVILESLLLLAERDSLIVGTRGVRYGVALRAARHVA
jgi:exopolyphosphatase/guanosine-5'-triphosphate,3'-diphosphate pyrophosphatase